MRSSRKRRAVPGAHGHPSRPSLVRCLCKSHCTRLNPSTGIYEGDGLFQSRSTRDNHRRDDRFREILTAPRLGLPASDASEVNPLSSLSEWTQQCYEEINALMEMPLVYAHRPLVFSNRPEDHGPFLWPSDYTNSGSYKLTSDRANQPFLVVANRLLELKEIVQRKAINTHYRPLDALLQVIDQKLKYLLRLKEVEWSQQRGNSGVDDPYINTEIHFQPFPMLSRAQKVGMLTSLVMENVFFISRRALRTLLGGARSLSRASGASAEDVLSIMKDPRSGPYRARLDPTTRQFVVCVSCHYLYPYVPGDSPTHPINSFQRTCSQRRTPESNLCNTPLWKEEHIGNGRIRLIPARKYVHQDLKSWIGRLLSRKGMEALLRSATTQTHSPSIHHHDIWSSSVFRDLKGINREQPFFPGPPEELRLAFSLSVDSFNPFHMKTAKQTVSSTGIWMVLLNLPPHLRYLHENMYVAGVIPGPDKPSKEDIYPYILLVVKDLLDLWFTGVRYSRTEEQLLGILVRAILVPLICDMLAARQVTGLSSSTSHHFCTFCDMDIDDINVYDRNEWPTKNIEHVQNIALLWRDASNEAARKMIFECFGIKWSPLHLLPYWDVVRYTVVDPMHALDLNLFQNHCRHIFQIDTENPGGNGESVIPARPKIKQISSKADKRSLEICINLIRQNVPDLAANLVQHPRIVLYTICVDNSILGEGHKLVVGTRWILACNIFHWRNSEMYHSIIHNVPVIVEAAENQTNPEPDIPTSSQERLVTRVLRNLTDNDDPDARERAFNQGTAAVFEQICRLAHIDYDDIDAGKRSAKRQLYERIITNIDNNMDTCQNLLSIVAENAERNRGISRAVLGKDIMKQVWDDMRHTQLPTWITAAPRNWGTTQHGKLSANNWRVICTIHLPITLIRLWGNNVSERKKLILSNFMDLVSAVQIANMRITSEHQIEAYNAYMGRYISQVQELFPDQGLKPSHHAALHIGDMLGLFGPNHSHNGSHYERYINFFHRVNTNMKIGQLESTLLMTSARSANTRALLQNDEDARTAVHELVAVLDQVDREDVRGFRLASILDPDSPAFTQRTKPFPGLVKTEHHLQLCNILGQDPTATPQTALFIKEVSKDGVCYGTCTSSTFRNSSIIFSDRDTDTTIAGIIIEIFQFQINTDGGHTAKEIFLIVNPLEPIEAHLDPYRSFAFGGFLCKATKTEFVISLAQVKSHFAQTKFDINHDLIHVLPLDKSMLEFDIPSLEDLNLE